MRGLWATARAAVAEALSNRAALISQMAAMIINDGVWILFWALFFHRAGSIGGWDLDGIILLQAVLTSAGGIALGLLANARRIGVLAVDGGLDPVLALPTRPLAHVLLRRVEPTNLGDLVFGVCLYAALGHPTLQRTGLFVLVVLAAATLLTGFLVLTGSMAFFAGRSEAGELGFHAMLLLGAYPMDIFAGTAKLLLYTVLPAAFVSTVPARLIQHFDLGQALTLAAVAAGMATAAVLVFRAGLRRYTSGAVWTRA
jgi:ABC-2 type transport system permease protein